MSHLLWLLFGQRFMQDVAYQRLLKCYLWLEHKPHEDFVKTALLAISLGWNWINSLVCANQLVWSNVIKPPNWGIYNSVLVM